jgi:hypothetical protein
MGQLAGRDGRLDPVEKADELLVAVPRHALADDDPVEDVEESLLGREPLGMPARLLGLS